MRTFIVDPAGKGNTPPALAKRLLMNKKHLNCIIIDESGNIAYITRNQWMKSGKRVDDGMQCGGFGGVPSQYGCRTYAELDKVLEELNKPQPAYHWENVKYKYGKPYIQKISPNFNENDKLRIIGKLTMELC